LRRRVYWRWYRLFRRRSLAVLRRRFPIPLPHIVVGGGGRGGCHNRLRLVSVSAGRGGVRLLQGHTQTTRLRGRSCIIISLLGFARWNSSSYAHGLRNFTAGRLYKEFVSTSVSVGKFAEKIADKRSQGSLRCCPESDVRFDYAP
jgi:hypothetical protein